MRLAAPIAALALAILVIQPAAAGERQKGLMIDLSPRSWLDAGTGVQEGYGRDYATNTAAFGGGPVNGISSRHESNLPERGRSRGIVFDFLGANVLR